jgi:hypothetical protein
MRKRLALLLTLVQPLLLAYESRPLAYVVASGNGEPLLYLSPAHTALILHSRRAERAFVSARGALIRYAYWGETEHPPGMWPWEGPTRLFPFPHPVGAWLN